MRTRALLATLGVFVLIAAVSIAARGSTPSGSNAGRAPDPLLDTILTFFLIATIPAAVLYIYGVLHGALPPKFASPSGTLGSILQFAVFLMVIGALYVWVQNRNRVEPAEETAEQGFPGSPRGTQLPTASESTYDPEVAWIPALVVFGLAAVAIVAYVVSVWRAREGVRRRKTVAEAMAAALDESLDDLRAEADPRRAVIAAYARLERVLAAQGLPRHASETPEELLRRILPRLDVDWHSIRRLTDLFTWAKFSHHDVDADMKEEAIAALVQVRDELREAAAAAEHVPVPTLRAGGSPA